ncbi:MAG: AtpZ/AtpI family protein [Syntrophobacterales bacterium]|nr:AtpZ/AtpI family protein [Syntrophobacterales bacterium]
MGKTGKETSKKKIMFQMGYASSLGIAMVIAIFGCLMIGLYLDRKLGTHNVFTPLFLLIGVAAGFRNFYLFIKSTFPDDAEGQDKDMNNGRHKENHHAKKH